MIAISALAVPQLIPQLTKSRSTLLLSKHRPRIRCHRPRTVHLARNSRRDSEIREFKSSVELRDYL